MSSLAATQADGYYLPPGYFEGGAYKKQSKNAFFASTSRNGKKIGNGGGHNQYLQRGVVRFELPYKGVCHGCGESIGRGTRYNAHKTNAGRYFSTTIYQFAIKCRNCQHPWIIRTNPKERGFDYVDGIQVQAGQETNLAMGDCILEQPTTKGTTSMTNHDDDGAIVALQQLESAAHGKRRTLTEQEELQRLQKLNTVSTLLDADNNAFIRKGFRKDRKEKRKRLEHASQRGWRDGMELFADDTTEDMLAAKEMTYGRPKEEERKRLQLVRSSSIFASSLTRPSDKHSRVRRKKIHHTGKVESILPSPIRSNNNVLLPNQPITDRMPTTTTKTTTKRTIQIIVGVVSSGGVTTTTKAQLEPLSSSSSSSLADMMAGYGSSDDDDYHDVS
jgi:coiled-coil domain-containing protein 130